MSLDAALIEHDLKVRRVGRNVICFDEVNSTNDVAFQAARQADADGLAVFAESQRAGRGRLGRRWVSPPHANLLLSVLLLETGPKCSQEAITIAAGVAVAEAVEDIAGVRGELKWPNDVLVHGAKLAGILVEKRQIVGNAATVVGVGINVNAAPSHEDLDREITCLANHTDAPVDRLKLARALLQSLDTWIAAASRGDVERLHDAWISRCGTLGWRLEVLSGGQRHTGRLIDVHPTEGLVLACDDGRRVHLPAATSTIVSL